MSLNKLLIISLSVMFANQWRKETTSFMFIGHFSSPSFPQRIRHPQDGFTRKFILHTFTTLGPQISHFQFISCNYSPIYYPGTIKKRTRLKCFGLLTFYNVFIVSSNAYILNFLTPVIYYITHRQLNDILAYRFSGFDAHREWWALAHCELAPIK
jgi:hypothetical protein